MKSKGRVLVVSLAMVLFLTGCAQIGSGVAPSTVPLGPGGYETIGPVTGESCLVYLLGFLPLGEFNSVQAAVRDALSKSPGATALVQVTADTRRLWFLILTQDCTLVQGTAVKAG